MRPTKAQLTMAKVAAMFDSFCPECDDWIKKGQEIKTVQGEPRHVKCPSKVTSR